MIDKRLPQTSKLCTKVKPCHTTSTFRLCCLQPKSKKQLLYVPSRVPTRNSTTGNFLGSSAYFYSEIELEGIQEGRAKANSKPQKDIQNRMNLPSRLKQQITTNLLVLFQTRYPSARVCEHLGRCSVPSAGAAPARITLALAQRNHSHHNLIRG